MQKNIEVEVRGVLTKNQFLKVKDFLDKNSQTKEFDNKNTYFFIIPGFILKVTDEISKKDAKITLKIGNETLNILKEYEIKIPKDSVENAVTIFKELGFNKVNYVRQTRTNYTYKQKVISLKYTPDWGYHFEIETMVKTEIEGEIAKKDLLKLCNELNITAMTADQIKKKIDEINLLHNLA